MRRDGWFTHIRKPDFQRETNAWTPEDCADFLDSVINGRIIPSIILWNSPENNLIYVLDGAHRLSVIRAWMQDDWGDKADDYYQRRDPAPIRLASDAARRLLRERQIGSFTDFAKAWQEMSQIIAEGGSPKKTMHSRKFAQASLYQQIVAGLATLSVQWERGNFDSAEQSFLRINRKGQTLDPWEATLIEFRKSSYVRSVMSIANGGESGHYWPEPTTTDGLPDDLLQVVHSFSAKAAAIHRRLFVPPFREPISDLNVPLMVAPAYFQKHKYLLEVIPLVTESRIAADQEAQISLMQRDATADAQTVVTNADVLLTRMENALEHLISPTHSSTSLAIVPLFYAYNHRGQFSRGLLYAFLYWMLAGTADDIANRKLIFAANRDRFEHVLFALKPEIATVQPMLGAGLKVVPRLADFLHALLQLLHNHPDLPLQSDELVDTASEILQEHGKSRGRRTKPKTSRTYSTSDKNQINIREMFRSAVRCHICGGVVNLQAGGLQYDHTVDYAQIGITDPETGRPTHPFCNRYKQEIRAYRSGEVQWALGSFETSVRKQELQAAQLTFWGESNFPG